MRLVWKTSSTFQNTAVKPFVSTKYKITHEYNDLHTSQHFQTKIYNQFAGLHALIDQVVKLILTKFLSPLWSGGVIALYSAGLVSNLT